MVTKSGGGVVDNCSGPSGDWNDDDDGDNDDRLRELGWIDSALVPVLIVWFTNLCFFLCVCCKFHYHASMRIRLATGFVVLLWIGNIPKTITAQFREIRYCSKKCMTFCTFAVWLVWADLLGCGKWNLPFFEVRYKIIITLHKVNVVIISCSLYMCSNTLIAWSFASSCLVHIVTLWRLFNWGPAGHFWPAEAYEVAHMSFPK